MAYKNAVGARRASWRIISSVEQKEKSKGNTQNVPHAEEYRKKVRQDEGWVRGMDEGGRIDVICVCQVEDELNKICQNILVLLDKHLIPSSTTVGSYTTHTHTHTPHVHVTDPSNNHLVALRVSHPATNSQGESKVFYYKMKGDYYRYISEFSQDDTKTTAANSAHDSYKEASTIAQTDLFPTHPIRLGLALNFSGRCDGCERTRGVVPCAPLRELGISVVCVCHVQCFTMRF